MKILWLAPVLNHYKARFLNHLANVEEVNLTVLSGSGRTGSGDKELQDNWGFETVRVAVPKSKFGLSNKVRKTLKSNFENHDWVLIPAEKKNLLMFLYAMFLRLRHKRTKLFSYNHQFTKPKSGNVKGIDLYITRFFFKHLDRVIFYTEDSCEKAIRAKLIIPEKAFWANNTIDTQEVDKFYNFTLPPEKPITILFIGRLIPSKRIKDVISYYKALKTKFQHLKLDIIGDGPEQSVVKNAIHKDINIKWHGTLVDESKIAPIMKNTSLVFIAGLSGLSINHAFAYGRPYFTLKADKHGPEISYLNRGENGYILEDRFEEDVKLLTSIIEDREKLVLLCNNANKKGKELSVQKWVNQLKSSLLHES
ncbi:glycosyltransferase family 4 protein [Flavobacteriaceae bacterium]|nr:glycosyltransferase family 4 protein [Flavobacteriaceae bacterium]